MKDLRTAAQPAEWVGLTKDEILDLVADADLDWYGGWPLDDEAPNRYAELARAIEAKLRAKNGGAA